MPAITPIKEVTNIGLDLDLNEAADLLQVLSSLGNHDLKAFGLTRQFRARINKIQDSLESVEEVVDRWEKRDYKTEGE